MNASGDYDTFMTAQGTPIRVGDSVYLDPDSINNDKKKVTIKDFFKTKQKQRESAEEEKTASVKP